MVGVYQKRTILKPLRCALILMVATMDENSNIEIPDIYNFGDDSPMQGANMEGSMGNQFQVVPPHSQPPSQAANPTANLYHTLTSQNGIPTQTMGNPAMGNQYQLMTTPNHTNGQLPLHSESFTVTAPIQQSSSSNQQVTAENQQVTPQNQPGTTQNQQVTTQNFTFTVTTPIPNSGPQITRENHNFTEPKRGRFKETPRHTITKEEAYRLDYNRNVRRRKRALDNFWTAAKKATECGISVCGVVNDPKLGYVIDGEPSLVAKCRNGCTAQADTVSMSRYSLAASGRSAFGQIGSLACPTNGQTPLSTRQSKDLKHVNAVQDLTPEQNLPAPERKRNAKRKTLNF